MSTPIIFILLKVSTYAISNQMDPVQSRERAINTGYCLNKIILNN